MAIQSVQQQQADVRARAAKMLINTAASRGGQYIKQDGRYIFRIKTKPTLTIKEDGLTFVAELDVVDAAPIRDDVKPHTVGSSVSFIAQLEANKSAAGNMKNFILGLFNLDESSLSDDAYQEKVNDTLDKGEGMFIGAETYRKVTKGGPNAGKEGVYPNFSFVDQAEASTAYNK